MNSLEKIPTIGFDARMVAYRQAGIGQYCLNLLRELATLQTENGQFRLAVYQSRKEARDPAHWLDLKGSTSLEKRVLWTPPHHRLEQLALPLELLPANLDLLHSPDFIPPLRRYARQGWGWQKVKSIITIHDLAFMKFDYLLTDESRHYYGQIKQAAHSADKIIAVSKSTARDVCDLLDIALDKVAVIYEAANPLFKPLTPEQIASLGLGMAKVVSEKLRAANIADQQSFILFVSTIEPRKNLAMLLRAFRQLLDAIRDNNIENVPKLVIAGRPGWLYDDIYQQAQQLNLQNHLVWLGGVETAELLYLYNRAALLAMPSLYEGFGLPPLEAVACGTPALVANISSLPEIISEEVGMHLSPNDESAWTGAMQQWWQLRHENKVRLREIGEQYASQFSWRKAAQETLTIYLSVLK